MTDLENKLAAALVKLKYKITRNIYINNEELLNIIKPVLKEYYDTPINKLK